MRESCSRWNAAKISVRIFPASTHTITCSTPDGVLMTSLMFNLPFSGGAAELTTVCFGVPDSAALLASGILLSEPTSVGFAGVQFTSVEFIPLLRRQSRRVDAFQS
jgi:hypothetical protein